MLMMKEIDRKMEQMRLVMERMMETLLFQVFSKKKHDY